MALTHQTHARRQQVLSDHEGSQNRVTVRLVRDGVESEPDEAPTFAVCDSAGTAVLAADDMTLVTGSDASYYYDVDTTDTDTWTVGRGYRATITAEYTEGEGEDAVTSSWVRQIWLDVVPRLLIFDLCDDDLVARHHELADAFAAGQVSHADAIFSAEQEILADLFEARDQSGPINPDRLVGSEQLYRWHLYLTLAILFRDLRDNDMATFYSGEADRAREAALASAAIGADNDENPDADSQDNLGIVWLTR